MFFDMFISSFTGEGTNVSFKVSRSNFSLVVLPFDLGRTTRVVIHHEGREGVTQDQGHFCAILVSAGRRGVAFFRRVTLVGCERWW